MDEERRRRTRVVFTTEVELTCGDRTVKSSQSRNVSMTGIFICTDQRLEPGSRCQITVRLQGASSDLRLTAEGRVARVADDGLAVEFTSLDLDSYVHLRNLIVYNAEDPDGILEEVSHPFIDPQKLPAEENGK
jgi:hypothetical protein